MFTSLNLTWKLMRHFVFMVKSGALLFLFLLYGLCGSAVSDLAA